MRPAADGDLNSTKNSNLFLKELIFGWSIISFLTDFMGMELESSLKETF